MAPWPIFSGCLSSSPWAYFLFNEFLFLAGYTGAILLHPSTRFSMRLFAVLNIFFITLNQLQPALFNILRPQWRTAAMNGIWMQFLSAADVLLFAKVDGRLVSFHWFHGRGRPFTVSGFMMAMYDAVCLSWNMRRVGTPWEIKGLRTETPVARWRWVAGRLTHMAIAYLLLDAICLGPPPNREMLAPGKESFWLSGLGAEDLGFRVAATLGFGLSAGLIVLLMQLGIAVACVTLGLGRPEDFPPYFGSLGDAYSVGRFWSLFWHKCLVRIITAPASFITISILRTPRGEVLSRYTRLFLAFFVSGLIHVASDYGLGVSPDQSGAMVFFLLQPVGILLEHQVQNLFRGLGGGSFNAVKRAIGYVWLVVWMAWCAPVWIYPQLRAPGVDSAETLPVRVLPIVARFFS